MLPKPVTPSRDVIINLGAKIADERAIPLRRDVRMIILARQQELKQIHNIQGIRLTAYNLSRKCLKAGYWDVRPSIPPSNTSQNNVI